MGYQKVSDVYQEKTLCICGELPSTLKSTAEKIKLLAKPTTYKIQGSCSGKYIKVKDFLRAEK